MSVDPIACLREVVENEIWRLYKSLEIVRRRTSSVITFAGGGGGGGVWINKERQRKI